jgi:lambda family phage portal protein
MRRRILHHYRPSRPEQTRGVPYLAPVIQTIHDLGRFTEAEITAAVINSFFTVFIETEGSAGPAPVFGAQGTGPAGDEIQLGAGAVVGLAKGEKMVSADPKRPNPNAEAFILGMLKLIGMGLGIPFEVLVKQFNSSFSASKAALLDAWMHFRTERAWLINSFCQPVLETWLAEAVASNRISAPGFFTDPLRRWAYTRAAWHGDSQGSINPKDEVDAYLAAVDGRLMTRERAEWELFGSDWHRTYPAKKREQQMLARDGLLPVPKAGAPAPAPGGSNADALA